MKIFRGIGLMSGTSLDGVDLAYCEFYESEGKWKFELLAGETIPMDEKWYARLHCLDTVDARTYAKTHVYFGHYLGRLLASFIERNEARPHFVASHGQTIFHQPEKSYTAQIGDGETMVSYLDCPLVCNFRNKDLALGGQGAPLVPFSEQLLFSDHRVFLNLGGIANVSCFQADGKVLAFDISPCNMALNWLCRSFDPQMAYDEDGELAATGQVNEDLLQLLDSLNYYKKAAPKSLGTEWFEAKVLPLIGDDSIPVADRLRTVCAHIVHQIEVAMVLCKAIEEPLMITGGGARNTFLMRLISDKLSPYGLSIAPVKDQILDFKEAIAFGFLGLHTLLGRPNILQSVTGAKMNVMGGSIHLPPNGWQALL